MYTLNKPCPVCGDDPIAVSKYLNFKSNTLVAERSCVEETDEMTFVYIHEP